MTSENSPILTIRGLCKSFGDAQILRGIDLEIHKGEVVYIIGASGSGKSTLLRCLNLLEDPSGGEIYFRGRPIHQLAQQSGRAADRARNAVRAEIGMVFQHFNLWPHKTVLENITTAPMIIRRQSRSAAEQEARQLLQTVGLLDKCNA